MLGCRINGGQAEYVRVPYADNGLTPIPDNVGAEQALPELLAFRAPALSKCQGIRADKMS